MGQMSWRADDELLERVRQQASDRGLSLNEWVTQVLAAVSDPDSAGSDAARIRERLRAAGLLQKPTARPRRKVDPERLSKARAAAGRGAALSTYVVDGRR